MAKRVGVLEKKDFSLNDFKTNVLKETQAADKKETWIPMSKAFCEATGLPGIYKGVTTLSRGFSNTGKSTVLFEAAVSCQKEGILPVFIDTENNLNRTHLALMGFDWEGDYIYADNNTLIENYAKPRNKDAKEASIEDVASFINDILDKQEDGKLPMDVCFLWDSIGSVDCMMSIKALEKDSNSNNMWNANALEKSFKSILNYRIPTSNKVTSPYTNTIIACQKIWLDSQQGAGVVKHKGGEAFFYGARLIIHLGGIQSHGTSPFKATKDKRDITFGIETKIKVVKNQVNGISYDDGRICSTPHGFIGSDKASQDEYKKKNLQYFKDSLGIDGDFDFKIDDSVSEFEFGG